MGVEPKDLKFQQKTIVDVLKNGKLELAITATLPPPNDYVERLKEYSIELFKMREFNLDISDYIYNTINYEKGITPENIIEKRSQHFYDHTSFLNIFPTPIPVTHEQRIALEGLYNFYHQPDEEKSRKEETT